MNIEPISKLIKWFLPLLIKSDESTYSEISQRAKVLGPNGAAVVMALWKVIVHKFTESAETHELLSTLEQRHLSPDSVERFFKKLENITHEDHNFAITLDYLYHSSERVDEYYRRVVRGRLAGDISTDAPPPEGKKKKTKRR